MLNRFESKLLTLLPTRLERHVQFIKFLFIGSFNTFLDITLFYIFSSILYWGPIISNIISTSITMTISFYLNYTFVFKSKNNRLKTAILFIFITLFNGWVIQSMVIYSIIIIGSSLVYFETNTGLLNLAAKVCGVAIAFMLNFLGYRIIFNRRGIYEKN